MIHYKKIAKSYLNDAGFEYRKNNKIEYLVIHYTAGANDSAEAVARYFKQINKDKSRYASSHYIVDDKSCFQCVEDKYAAWHCGGDKYKYSTGGSLYGKCTNLNSLGIEMCKCLNKLDYDTLKNCIAIGKKLIAKYNIKDDHVIRHYDVTGKHCPALMIDDNPDYKNNWKLLHKALTSGSDNVIEIKKDGTIYKKKRGEGYKWIKLGQFK